jgi:hypothetical protein
MMRRLSLAVTLLTLCLVASPALASAYDPFGTVCSTSSASNSAVCSTIPTTDPTLSPINPITDNLIKITNIIAYIAGAAAIIMILISALRFVTSGSDVSTGSRTDADVETARRSIANALIGLAVIVLGRTLIVFVLNKL